MIRKQPEAERTTPGRRSRSLDRYSKFTGISRLGTLLAYSALIIYFGTARIVAFPGDEILSHDKILHAIAFGGLSVLAYRCLVCFRPRISSGWALGLATGFSTAIGAALEILQSMLPYRSMEFADLLSDFIGAILFVVLAKRTRLDRPLFGVGI